MKRRSAIIDFTGQVLVPRPQSSAISSRQDMIGGYTESRLESEAAGWGWLVSMIASVGEILVTETRVNLGIAFHLWTQLWLSKVLC